LPVARRRGSQGEGRGPGTFTGIMGLLETLASGTASQEIESGGSPRRFVRESANKDCATYLAIPTISSRSLGFVRKQLAPSLKAILTSDSKGEDVSTTTGKPCMSGRPAIQASTSNPFIFGILRSSSSNWGNGN